MQTVERSSRILNLLSGTDALRQMISENKRRNLRLRATATDDVNAVGAVNAGEYYEREAPFRKAGIAAAPPRPRNVNLAVTMNFGTVVLADFRPNPQI